VDRRKIKSIVKNFLKAVEKNNIKIEAAIIFGSYAKGNADNDSDIDIALISPDFGKDKFEEAILLKKISEDIYLGISPEPYSLEEYNQAKQGDFLFQEIIQKGVFVPV